MKMRLIDAIESWESHRSIRGRKVVSFEEYMMRGPLGNAESLPESLALGAVVELAAWLTILSSDFESIALPCGLEAVRILSAVGPGERLELTLRQHVVGNEIFVNGQGKVGDRMVLEVAELEMGIHPLGEFFDPDDLRVLYSEIHRSAVEVAA
jgi:3-hydroxymyristoyl/3-hydroxydecanoyl-(acyl carrier protein) dehydratase